MAFVAKVRSLQVRPIHSADLSFNVAGVIDERNMALAKLGATVPPFNFRDIIIGQLTAGNFAPDGEFRFGPAPVQAVIGPAAVYVLRNDATSAAAVQAILQRKIAFLQKYKHGPAIIAAFRRVYPEDAQDPKGKLARLNTLAQLHEDKEKDLQEAYKRVDEGEWAGVVSAVRTDLTNEGTATSTTSVNPIGMLTPEHVVEVRAVEGAPAAGNANHLIKPASTIPQSFADGTWKNVEVTENFGFTSHRTTQDPSLLKQKSVIRGQDFRYPSMDSAIRGARAQIDLLNETLNDQTIAMRIPDLPAIFEAELALLNQEIFKAIIRYSQTFLFSPVPGRVTAIYKDVGEAVQAGEPVLRVENDDTILLVGSVQARAPIEIGQAARVVARHVFESGDDWTLAAGRVVAVRGHDADDDVWEVIIECKNEAAGKAGGGRKLPVNYKFDKVDTEVHLG